MTADKPTPVVPNLRFPEFRSAGHWHFQPLSDIAEPISERVGTSKCVPMSVTTGVGLLSQDEKFGRTIAGNSYKNYIRLQTNDFAYNKSATKEFPQGYIARYSGTRDAAVPNSIFSCFRPDAAAVIPEYLDHLLHGNHHGRWLRKYITVGARAHGALSVSDDALMSMPVPLPPVAVSRPEQQKVADCLGSLDDLITAESRKLEALRQHKQGLMQQLFPQPGETAPRLRFPEFRDAPAWSSSPLESVCEVLNKRRVPITTKDRKAGPFPYYGASGIVDYIDDFIFDERTILVGEDGAKWGPFEQTAFIAEGKYWVNNHAHVLRSVDLIDSLLEAYLVRSDLGPYVTGAAPPKLTLGKLKTIPIPIPSSPAEQQYIADCLGSLDDLIAAESRELDALRQHKQGLMQQLFPSLEAESR